jgi:hypothetical protein
MIISKEIFRVRLQQGKWKSAFVQLKKRVGDYFEWEDQKQVYVVIFEENENPSSEEIQSKLDEFKQMEEVFNNDGNKKRIERLLDEERLNKQLG